MRRMRRRGEGIWRVNDMVVVVEEHDPAPGPHHSHHPTPSHRPLLAHIQQALGPQSVHVIPII